ncbi:MAG: peptidylprolyl isomerase [Candidatus Methylomirabilales bacterium]
MRGRVLMGAILLVGVTGGLCAGADDPAPGDADAKRVVARVNQVEISYAEFKQRLENLQPQRGPIRPEQFNDVVHGMIQEEILLQDATAEGVEQDAAVKAKLEQARRQVLIEELLRRKVIAQSQVTDEEARKMYEDNKPLFSTETVRVSHIMVKTEAEAEAILKDLQAGKDFAELAKTTSQDTGSAEKGGDLGELRHGQTVQEFEEEAFRLKEGELSPVIKTQYGYHILKGGAHASVAEPFDEVKGKIRQSLLQQKQQESFLAFMADLEKKAKTEIFEDQLR